MKKHTSFTFFFSYWTMTKAVRLKWQKMQRDKNKPFPEISPFILRIWPSHSLTHSYKRKELKNIATILVFHSSCSITTGHRHNKSRLSENPIPWRVINLGVALLESTCRGNWRAAFYSVPIWIHYQSQKNKCTEGKFQGCSSGGHSPSGVSWSLSCIQDL